VLTYIRGENGQLMNAHRDFRVLRYIMTLVVLLAGVVLFENKSVQAASSDPLNVPLDSLGATGYDKTLCSDRWNTCSNYDRQQFNQRYPGRPLEELSLYPLARGLSDGYESRHKWRDVYDEYRSPSEFQRQNGQGRPYRP